MANKPFCGKCKKPKSQCKCGRPTKMTDECIGKLEEALRIDCTVGMACSYAWIDESTYYDHYKKNPVFSKKMDDAEKWLHILAHKEWTKLIETWDKDMIKEFKRKRDIRYKDKTEVEMDMNVNLQDLPMDDLLKMIKAK